MPVQMPKQQQEKELLWIIACVVSVHLVAIALSFVTYTPFLSPHFEAPKRLVVQTISLSSPQNIAMAEVEEEEWDEEVAEADPTPPPPLPTKPTPVKTPPHKPLPKPAPLKKPAKLPPPKKLPKPASLKPTKTPVKKPAAPKTHPVDKAAVEQQQKHQALLAEAQERIAKIGKNRDKGAAQGTATTAIAAAPKSIASLEIDGLATSDGPQLSDKEMSYRDEVAGRLKLMLRLPQFGEVKVKLTLNRLGKVVKVVVVNAESSENKKHIEKMLPTLTFPPYGSQFADEEHTLTITLRNE